MSKTMSIAKKLLILFTCALSILMFAGCSKGGYMPNPFVDCKTMADAKKLSGFEFTVPEKVNGYEQSLIQATNEKGLKLVQVFYTQSGNEILVRKAAGTVSNLDGDYNEYKVSVNTKVNNIAVAMKGASENAISVATWTNNGYTYSITAKGVTLTQSAVAEIVKAVK